MKVEIKAPKNLSEITLGKYLEFQKFKDPTPEQVVGLFCEGDIRKVPKAATNQIAEDVINILQSGVAIHAPTIEIDGREFGMCDFANFTTGEYIDTEAFGKNQQLDKILAVIYRPITKRLGERYLVEDYEDHHQQNAEMMREVGMDVVNGLMLFFSTIENELLETTRQHSKSQLKEKLKEAKEILGGGMSS